MIPRVLSDDLATYVDYEALWGKGIPRSLRYRYITDFSDFLARIESCQLVSVVGR